MSCMKRPGGDLMEAIQPHLIAGFYRCDDCGRLCDRLRKTRRFRLCDDCYERIVPRIIGDVKVVHGTPEQQAMTRYWEWYDEIDRRVPQRRQAGYTAATRRPGEPTPDTDEIYPYCECGEMRRQNTIGRSSRRQLSLFGGPFFDLCPACEAKRAVDEHVRATSWLHSEWDDEEWLDLLWRVMPDAFELGVLPGYWFELRRGL